MFRVTIGIMILVSVLVAPTLAQPANAPTVVPIQGGDDLDTSEYAQPAAPSSQGSSPHTCSGNLAKIPRLFGSITKIASNQLLLFEEIRVNAWEFYSSQELAPAAEVTAAQTAAGVSSSRARETVKRMEGSRGGIDCTDPDTKQRLGDFLDDTKTLRGELRAYRQDILDLIAAIRTAVDAAQPTSEPTDDRGAVDTEEAIE